jgi:hypothetical protein
MTGAKHLESRKWTRCLCAVLVIVLILGLAGEIWAGYMIADQWRKADKAVAEQERLKSELDMLQSLGINNLRILVGADAGSGNANTVQPYLQPAPGCINDTLLHGLDYLLCEMESRGMVGVFYLTNSWDWSGGYGFYLKQTGHGDSPNANGEGYNQYVKYASQFVFDAKAKELYYDFVRTIVGRTNSISGRRYADEPSIMSWQICNEPRPFSKEGKEAFAEFDATKKCKSILLCNWDEKGYVLSHTYKLKAETLEKFTDVIVTSANFAWTYCKTHEYDCGPYFYRPKKKNTI